MEQGMCRALSLGRVAERVAGTEEQTDEHEGAGLWPKCMRERPAGRLLPSALTLNTMVRTKLNDLLPVVT